MKNFELIDFLNKKIKAYGETKLKNFNLLKSLVLTGLLATFTVMCNTDIVNASGKPPIKKNFYVSSDLKSDNVTIIEDDEEIEKLLRQLVHCVYNKKEIKSITVAPILTSSKITGKEDIKLIVDCKNDDEYIFIIKKKSILFFQYTSSLYLGSRSVEGEIKSFDNFDIHSFNAIRIHYENNEIKNTEVLFKYGYDSQETKIKESIKTGKYNGKKIKFLKVEPILNILSSTITGKEEFHLTISYDTHEVDSTNIRLSDVSDFLESLNTLEIPIILCIPKNTKDILPCAFDTYHDFSEIIFKCKIGNINTKIFQNYSKLKKITYDEKDFASISEFEQYIEAKKHEN